MHILATAAAGLAAAATAVAPAAVAPVFVRHQLPPGPYGQVVEAVGAGDLNGDRRPDVVVAGDRYLLWYPKPGGAAQLIARGAFGAGAMTLVRDLDRDGRPDVVTGQMPGAEEVWFANTRRGWVRHVLSADAYCHDLVVVRVGDAVCVDQQRRRIVLLRRTGAATASWTVSTIQGGISTMGLAVADVDRDGRLDVVAGRSWYRDEGGGRWARYPYTTLGGAYPGFDDFAKLAVLDLNGDGRPDVVASLFAESPGGRLYAFLAPRDPRRAWTPVLLDEGPLFGVHSLTVARFDGCARPEVVVAETNVGGWSFGTAPHPHVYLYRRVGASRWSRAVVDAIGAHDVQAADLDGDGRPDLVGHEENTDRLQPPRDGAVFWWRNATPRGRCGP